jgi:hypothetical protein
MPLDLTAGIPKYLPDLAANYTKRFLERGYDQVFQTGFGHWLLGLSPWKKYSLEMILYVITAVLDERLPEDSSLRKYAKQVVFDTAPEISKRMINGVREDVVKVMAAAKSPQEEEFFSVILSLDDSDIASLIRWFGYTKIERNMIIVQLARLSPEHRIKFLRLSEENREKLMEFFGPKEKEEPKPSEPKDRGIFGMMADDINNLNEKFEKTRSCKRR